MKHINITNWQGNITDWTKFNYIYGGLDDSLADRVNLRIPGTNLRNYLRNSNNLVNNSTDVFELGGVSYLPNHSYQEAKDTASPSVANARIRTKNLINVDPNKTYTVSAQSPYTIIAQGYNNDLGINATGTQFNQSLSVVTFTGVNQIAIIARYEDGRDFSSINDISKINIMLTEGTSTTYEPYGSMVMVENVGSDLQPLETPKVTIIQTLVSASNWDWGARPNYTYADRFVTDAHGLPKGVNGYVNWSGFEYTTSIPDIYPYVANNNGAQIVVNFSAKGTTTLEQFKEYVSKHPLIITYWQDSSTASTLSMASPMQLDSTNVEEDIEYLEDTKFNEEILSEEE